MRDRPVLWRPTPLRLPPQRPDRAAARSALGLDPAALVVLAPGLATPAKRLDACSRALERLRGEFPAARLRVTGGLADPDLVRELAAADVVLALRFPARGRVPRAALWAAALGRPALVSAATDEFPDGVVVPVDPGRNEEECLLALLRRLLGDVELRAAIGRVAAEHVRVQHDPAAVAESLARFLSDVDARKIELAARVAEARAPLRSLRGRLVDELRAATRELGLRELPPGLADLLRPLA